MLERLADSRNAIKTGKRGLTFREISLLLSLSLCRVNLVRLIFSKKNASPFFPLVSPIIVHCFPFVLGKLEKLNESGRRVLRRNIFLIFNLRYVTRAPFVSRRIGGRERERGRIGPIARKREGRREDEEGEFRGATIRGKGG